MTKAEWQSCGDPEPMVRLLAADRFQRELRLFSVACVRRVWSLLPKACQAAVELSEQFANGKASESKLSRAVDAAALITQEIWPGPRSPGARAYAASAAVDASSVWPRTTANVLAATSCAASAFACARAESATDCDYDAVFDASRRAELASQAVLLRGVVDYPSV